MLGFHSKSRPIHVVCTPKEDYLAIIKAYIPSDEEWEEDGRIAGQSVLEYLKR